MRGKLLRDPFILVDTSHYMWLTYYAMPINKIELNLTGLIRIGKEVLV